MHSCCVLLCFVAMLSFLLESCDQFRHVFQTCFSAGELKLMDIGNIVSIYGLLPDRNKAFPEPILSNRKTPSHCETQQIPNSVNVPLYVLYVLIVIIRPSHPTIPTPPKQPTIEIGHKLNRTFYHDVAVRSLGIPFSPNRKPRLPWRHHWKAVRCRSTTYG